MGTHQVLIIYLKSEVDPSVRLLGTKLELCRNARTDADYTDNPIPNIDTRRVKRIFNEVSTIESLISTLP